MALATLVVAVRGSIGMGVDDDDDDEDGSGVMMARGFV